MQILISGPTYDKALQQLVDILALKTENKILSNIIIMNVVCPQNIVCQLISFIFHKISFPNCYQKSNHWERLFSDD